MENIFYSTVKQLSAAIQKKEISAEKVMQTFLDRGQKLNSKLNAFVSWNDSALESAKKIDQQISKGEKVGPLAGVPIAIKDMLCTKGLKTTAGSKMLSEFVPPYSATVVERLESAGAITIAKTNQDEFAMGSSNENSFFGPVKNPWDTNHVPGGSSGGSAAAVAAGMAPAAIGTDTGGSIRQPAHFCGIVGVKPTYGRVSRYGIVAFASSLDQAGPMTRTVEDSALIMEAICGRDSRDSTTSERAVPSWSENLKKDLKGMTIGLPKEYFTKDLGDETRAVIENAIKVVRDAGAKTIEVSLPLVEYGVPIYYLIATSEASSNLARYDGVRYGHRAVTTGKGILDLDEFYSLNRGEGFGPEVKRRIMLGTYALSSGYYDAFYRKAGQVRRLLRQEFLSAFAKCDVLLNPVTTQPAFKIGERISDPLQMYLNDIYTTSTNLVGIPGMSVPGGFSKQGLPIGVQLSAAHFEEEKMLGVANVIELAVAINKKVPNGL